jgi:hypothetical protein
MRIDFALDQPANHLAGDVLLRESKKLRVCGLQSNGPPDSRYGSWLCGNGLAA